MSLDLRICLNFLRSLPVLLFNNNDLINNTVKLGYYSVPYIESTTLHSDSLATTISFTCIPVRCQVDGAQKDDNFTTNKKQS